MKTTRINSPEGYIIQLDKVEWSNLKSKILTSREEINESTKVLLPFPLPLKTKDAENQRLYLINSAQNSCPALL
jgi:hypothetical protein